MRYFLVDLDGRRVKALRRTIGERPDVVLLEGDCNRILPDQVFRQVEYRQRRRALCLLDPYGLQLNWKVIEAAGRLRTIDLFLNFPIMDANRNALWTKPDRVKASDAARLTAFWGDDSWRQIAYRPSPQGSLFGESEIEKVRNQDVADAFRQRLRTHAGFANVPAPMPMRNSANAVVYYLFFASQNDTANKIVAQIFRRYGRGRVEAS